MKRGLVLLLLIGVSAAAAELQAADSEDKSSTTCRCYRSSGWNIQQTENFRVCTRDERLDVDHLPALCESLRQRLAEAWLGDSSPLSWTPRCDVIVHASLREYQQTLGPDIGQSVGCATMKVDGERIISRRIDIRVDADTWQEDALPHELTHVLLSARFGGRRLPPWMDEGIGVLSESARKQQLRAAAFETSARRGILYQPTELLALQTFPRPEYREAFYAQSAALVQELVDRGSPGEFLAFMELALDGSSTHAMRQLYGIDDASRLTSITRPPRVRLVLSGEPLAESGASRIEVSGTNSGSLVLAP